MVQLRQRRAGIIRISYWIRDVHRGRRLVFNPHEVRWSIDAYRIAQLWPAAGDGCSRSSSLHRGGGRAGHAHGPPHACADGGMRITSGPERRLDRPAQPGEHMRRAGLPNLLEADELRCRGLALPRGHYLSWWGVTFVCASCLEMCRKAPPLPRD